MQNRQPAAVIALLAGLALLALPNILTSFLLPLILNRLALSIQVVVTLNTAHTLGLVLGALPMAALSARIGARRCFLVAACGVALSSVAMLAPMEFIPLLLLRLLQGIASAALLAASLALLRQVFGDGRFGWGLGLAGLAAGWSLFMLPMTAGWLGGVVGTPGLAVPGIVLLLAALLLGWRSLPRPDMAPQPFDILGTVLSLATFCLLLASLYLLPFRPALLVHPPILQSAILLLLGLLALALWIWQQSGRAAPMLPLDLLSTFRLGWPMAAACFGTLALMAAEIALATQMMSSWRMPPERIGLLLSVPAAMAALASLAGGWYVRRLPRRLPALAGALLMAGGLAVLAWLEPGPAFQPPLTLGLVLYGAGRGLFELGNTLLLVGGVPASRSSAAAGLLVWARGLGTLLISVCLMLAAAAGLEASAGVETIWLAFGAAVAVLAALLSLPGRTGAAR